MSDPEKKPDEKESPPTVIYQIGGDFIQGDKTSVGDITDSEGIAVGSGASATVEKGAASTQAAGDSAGGQALDPRAVYAFLVDKFSEQELEDLCFELRVEFEDLPGRSRKAKARELVSYMRRRGRLNELYMTAQELLK